jgi:hypothetical protein
MQQSVVEHRYIRDMLNLREEVLIKKGLLYFVLPAFILGILGYIFPYVFAFLPSHLVQVCTCTFFCRDWGHPFLNEDARSYYQIVLINVTSMTVTQFIYYTILLFMIYRIRHIDDETLIKRECAAIVGMWILFSSVNLVCFYV